MADSYNMTDTQITLHEWRQRLNYAGLSGLADGLVYALRPLGPLVAQFLWFSQPAFGMFGHSQLAGALAEFVVLDQGHLAFEHEHDRNGMLRPRRSRLAGLGLA